MYGQVKRCCCFRVLSNGLSFITSPRWNLKRQKMFVPFKASTFFPSHSVTHWAHVLVQRVTATERQNGGLFVWRMLLLYDRNCDLVLANRTAQAHIDRSPRARTPPKTDMKTGVRPVLSPFVNAHIPVDKVQGCCAFSLPVHTSTSGSHRRLHSWQKKKEARA